MDAVRATQRAGGAAPARDARTMAHVGTAIANAMPLPGEFCAGSRAPEECSTGSRIARQLAGGDDDDFFEATNSKSPTCALFWQVAASFVRARRARSA